MGEEWLIQGHSGGRVAHTATQWGESGSFSDIVGGEWLIQGHRGGEWLIQ